MKNIVTLMLIDGKLCGEGFVNKIKNQIEERTTKETKVSIE